MTTVSELENMVRTWVEGISGRDCYIQEQMGPVPTDPYCTIYLKNLAFPQYDLVSHACVVTGVPPDEIETYTLTVRGQASVTFAISAWGGTASAVMAICNRLRNSIWSDNRYTDLWTISGKGQAGAIIPLPEEYEGERRQRAEFEFTLHTALSDTFEVDHFNEVQITCRVPGKGEQTIVVGVDDDTFGTIGDEWSVILSDWGILG